MLCNNLSSTQKYGYYVVFLFKHFLVLTVLQIKLFIWVMKINIIPVFELNEFKTSLKSPQNRFQLSTGLNLEKFNSISSETNYI